MEITGSQHMQICTAQYMKKYIWKYQCNKGEDEMYSPALEKLDENSVM